MSGWKNVFGKITDVGKKFVSNFEEGGSSSIFNSVTESTGDVPPPITIGKFKIRFTRKLDEGGFSYVYSAIDVTTNISYAVKRLLIQDREQKDIVQKEIEVMKQINGHPCCIHLFGDKTERRNDAMVVWLLMELGEDSVIGLINSRLQSTDVNSPYSNSPTESQSPQFSKVQILRIFYDVCCAIGHLHSQNPPILHRDIKIENVLKCGKIFKLCDFGSCTTKIYNLNAKHERLVAEEDINKNTTLEYRAPEMVDLFSGHKINEKSDIWALGCLLYKLMYFQGPFDDASGLQIIAGKYELPPRNYMERKRLWESKNPDGVFDDYTDDLVVLIKAMLRIRAPKRPDIFTIISHVGNLLDVPENEIPKSRDGNVETKVELSTNSPMSAMEDGVSFQVRSKKKRTKKKRKKVKSLYDQLNVKSSPKKTEKQKPQVGIDDWDPDFGDTSSSTSKPIKSSTTSSKKSTPIQNQEEDEEMDIFSALDNWESSGQSKNPQKSQIRPVSPPKKQIRPVSPPRKNQSHQSLLSRTNRILSSPTTPTRTKKPKKKQDISFDWGEDFSKNSFSQPVQKKQNRINSPKKQFSTKTKSSLNVPQEHHRPHSSPPQQQNEDDILTGLFVDDDDSQKQKQDTDDGFSLLDFSSGPSKKKSPSLSNIHNRTKSFDAYNIPKNLDSLYNQPSQILNRNLSYRAGYQPVHTNGYYNRNKIVSPTYYQGGGSPGLINRQRQVSSDVAFIKDLVSKKREEMKKSRSNENFSFPF